MKRAVFAGVLAGAFALASGALAGDGSVAHAFRQALLAAAGNGLSVSNGQLGLTAGGAPAQLAAITTAAQGTLAVYAGGTWQALPPGTDGQVLESRVGTHALGLGWAAGVASLDVVKVRATSGQTINDGATDLLTYDTEDVDTAGVSPVGAGASTIVLTTGAAGEVWDVVANVAISTSMVAQASFQIRLYDTDGTTILARSVHYGTSDTWFYRSLNGKFVSTGANQTIRVALGHTSGAARTTDHTNVAGDVGVVAVRVRAP